MPRKKANTPIFMIRVIALIMVVLVIFSGMYFYNNLHDEEETEGDFTPIDIDPTEPPIDFNDPVYNVTTQSYSLPLNLNNITNLEAVISNVLTDDILTEQQLELLMSNGFVVLEDNSTYWYDDFVSAYNSLKTNDVPIFVTTDSMAHMYHVYFDESLKKIEEQHFIEHSTRMSYLLLNDSIDQYNNVAASLKDYAKRNVAFFSVALKLIEPDAAIPAFVQTEVDAELALIEAHGGAAYSNIIYGLLEDYSQYKPRGHYTDSEDLERYFKEMMWYGRIGFRAREYAETMQAIMITDAMRNNLEVQELWSKIYYVTLMFVGYSDDLSYQDYSIAIDEIYGDLGNNYQVLESESLYLAFKEKLSELREPKIVSSIIMDFEDPENATMGFRVMGQRFIPDGYIHQQLLHPNVQNRLMPKGLDVMSVMGSDVATELLAPEMANYSDYGPQHQTLTEEFAAFNDTTWTQNLYWGWLHSINALNQNFSNESYPTFMQTDSWEKKELNTQLASWAELRHDTILYAKQPVVPSYGFDPPPESRGYVEPVPKFYSRLANLAQGTLDFLVSASLIVDTVQINLELFIGILERLENISITELAGENLTDDDYVFIGKIGDKMEPIGNFSEDSKTTIIADVATDPNFQTCLEEGVGSANFMIVVVMDENETFRATVGPVFSYYEFTQPISNRLNDEEWTQMVVYGNAPPRPDWTSAFLA